MKVSICMITYNHEKYIREAIEGVLMQKCDFELEFIIANDCSTDKTDDVIQNILENHPKASWIKYIKHKENIGMMPNFIFALNECKGDYIALCEGDDYWIDPLKLQKQVDFLEENTNYVACFHNAEVHINTKNGKSSIHNFHDRCSKIEFTAEEILSKWSIPTASIVFKNVINEFPNFFKEAFHGDLALFVYLFDYGKMRFLNELMCVYRINDGSITVKWTENLNNIVKLINQLVLMNTFYNGKYKRIIDKKIFLLGLEKVNYYRNKSIFKQILLFIKTILYNPKIACQFEKEVKNSVKSIGVTLVNLKFKM